MVVSMKRIILLSLLLLVMLVFAVGINGAIIQHKHNILVNQQLTDAVQDARIAELEKEIRILKTDMDILQNGFKE